jgi:hypothetical protein
MEVELEMEIMPLEVGLATFHREPGGFTEIGSFERVRSVFRKREREESGDEAIASVHCDSNDFAHRSQVVIRRVGTSENDVEFGANDGQRRPQLVRRVRNEPAFAR